jgi:hypothetical protein
MVNLLFSRGLRIGEAERIGYANVIVVIFAKFLVQILEQDKQAVVALK